MKTPKISLIHATRGRPHKALHAMRWWLARCSSPKDVEYIFVVDPDDAETNATVNNPSIADEALNAWADYIVVGNPGRGSAPAWDAGYKASSGSLIIQVSDDQECPPHFDSELLSRLPEDWEDKNIVVAVSNGFRKDDLLTCFICTGAYASFCGDFISPAYRNVYSDDEATYRAYLNQKNGNATVINARDMQFVHRHPAHDPSIPWDATYEASNNPKSYERGRRIFYERNPSALTDGLATWR